MGGLCDSVEYHLSSLRGSPRKAYISYFICAPVSGVVLHDSVSQVVALCSFAWRRVALSLLRHVSSPDLYCACFCYCVAIV